MKLPKQLMNRRSTVGERFADDIVSKIKSGAWQPGGALPPTGSLADDYNISLVTAHKALQRLVEAGYLVRKSGRGTFVAETQPGGGNGKALVSGGVLGMPVYFQQNPIHLALVEEVSNQAPKYGFDLRMGQGEEEEIFIEKLADEGVKYMFRSPYDLEKEYIIRRMLKEFGITAININDFWNDVPDGPSVRTDMKSGVREIVEKLHEFGHERIVFVDESEMNPRTDILDALYKAHLFYGLPFTVKRVKCLMPYGRSWPADMFDEIMEDGSAVLFSYDFYALMFLEEMEKRGVVPGRDLSVIGIDNVMKSERVGLTSLAHPLQKLVSTAYSILDGEFSAEPAVHQFKPELIIRSSIGPCKK